LERAEEKNNALKGEIL